MKHSNENEEDDATQNRRLSVTLDDLPITGMEQEEIIDSITVDFYS